MPKVAKQPVPILFPWRQCDAEHLLALALHLFAEELGRERLFVVVVLIIAHRGGARLHVDGRHLFAARPCLLVVNVVLLHDLPMVALFLLLNLQRKLKILIEHFHS